MILWLQFIVCTGLILYAGTKLTVYGDIIAEKTGLGRTWIGVVLMASVTSLPELITGISSVTLFDVPDIAVGNVLGACMLNLLMIALLDVMGGSEPIATRAHQGQVLTAAFAILLLGLVILGIVAGGMIPSLAWIGAYTFVFMAVYIVAMRLVFLYERNRIAEFVREMAEEAQHQRISKAKAYTLYGVNALLIIGAALYLPHIGEQIAETTGVSQTLVGTIFIAISTTLPEAVVSIGALRIGSVDMALGNLFGSNLFNVVILAIDDILYTKGPLLSNVSGNHVLAASAGIMMTAIAIIGLTYRTSKKHLFIAWDSLGIVILYVVATAILYVKS